MADYWGDVEDRLSNRFGLLQVRTGHNVGQLESANQKNIIVRYPRLKFMHSRSRYWFQGLKKPLIDGIKEAIPTSIHKYNTITCHEHEETEI